jgi:hypothetical protein
MTYAELCEEFMAAQRDNRDVRLGRVIDEMETRPGGMTAYGECFTKDEAKRKEWMEKAEALREAREKDDQIRIARRSAAEK